MTIEELCDTILTAIAKYETEHNSFIDDINVSHEKSFNGYWKLNVEISDVTKVTGFQAYKINKT